jgi:hypothetical protein
MSEPVLVKLPLPWPSWFRNAQISIYNESFDAVERRQIYKDWWLSRYGARLDCDWSLRDGSGVSRWSIEFPDQETYTQCVLAWS